GCGRDDFFSRADAVEHLDVAVTAAPELDARGSKRPSPLTTRTTWRVPLSITALAGTAIAGSSLAPAWNTTSAYMSIFSRPSGFGISMRTRAVRVSARNSG